MLHLCPSLACAVQILGRPLYILLAFSVYVPENIFREHGRKVIEIKKNSYIVRLVSVYQKLKSENCVQTINE